MIRVLGLENIIKFFTKFAWNFCNSSRILLFEIQCVFNDFQGWLENNFAEVVLNDCFKFFILNVKVICK